jgi:hypothetical protein
MKEGDGLEGVKQNSMNLKYPGRALVRDLSGGTHEGMLI